MRKMIFALMFLLLVLAGCNTINPLMTETATAVPTASVNTATGSFFAIDEIGLGPEGYVSLTNITDRPADLGGMFMCQGSQCFELPDVSVDTGATMRVAVGSKGTIAAQGAFGELRPSDGEIVLATSKNLQDPKSFLAYLEWGSTPHADTEAAINAGLWIKGAFAPSSATATRLYRQDTGLWLFDTQ